MDRRTSEEKQRAVDSDEQGIYYNKTPLLSFNCLWNAAIGGRGVGKTFNYKCWALFQGGECVWVRRYAEDIQKVKGTFLTDLIGQEFVDAEAHEFRVEDDVLYMDDEPRIHFIALSTSRRNKSNSFHHVDKIIYDEFLEGYGGRYLKNEYQIWLELYETVARTRDVRTVFIANKTSFVNPYFTEWGVKPFTERIKRFKVGEGLIAVENYSNKKFEDIKRNTGFGKYIAGSAYGAYAIENEVWLDDNAMIGDKPEEARCFASIRDGDKTVGLWTDGLNIYCSWKRNGRVCLSYQTECREGEKALIRSAWPLKQCIEYWNMGCMYFEDNIIKNIMFDAMLSGGKRK